jgi:hypothetical protein
MARSPYELLGILPGATQEEVRAAFIDRVKVLHPDRFDQASQPREWQMANEMLREINEGYDRLNKSSEKKPLPGISQHDQELIVQCFELIRQEKTANIRLLKRRLRLGENRAAFVLEYLEQMGVLGPDDGRGSREIWVDMETYEIDFDPFMKIEEPPEEVIKSSNPSINDQLLTNTLVSIFRIFLVGAGVILVCILYLILARP